MKRCSSPFGRQLGYGAALSLTLSLSLSLSHSLFPSIVPARSARRHSDASSCMAWPGNRKKDTMSVVRCEESVLYPYDRLTGLATAYRNSDAPLQVSLSRGH
ncbi:hypothetical protein LY76DRAFT_388740 [Colletotrichum caudatum]|nr:hypothetical protein LY76DRAFT_388740 [Colletotrichum caudatum]